MSSRQEDILFYLKAQGAATLAEVAAAFEITKQGALRHLTALETAGLVASSSRKSGRGRPAHVYELAAAAGDRFPQGHRELANALVEFLPQEQLKTFFKRRARAMETEYAGRVRGLTLEERVREVARLATEHGHMAEVIPAGEGAYAIKQHNCPIADVAALTGHPCQAEQELYRRLLHADVKRDGWIPDGEPSCTYLIKDKG
jgi:predicted ArsR family transcriptional regulator